MSKAKIKNLQNLSKIIKALKQKKGIVVFTNGCFDLLHYGHIKYLEEAKRKGTILVVAINSDESVKKIKGKKRPIVPEKERAGVVAALESVDYVTIFNQTTPLTVIKKIKPDILIKGTDWKIADIVGAAEIKKYGGKVIRIKYVRGLSTTQLIQRIVKKNHKA